MSAEGRRMEIVSKHISRFLCIAKCKRLMSSGWTLWPLHLLYLSFCSVYFFLPVTAVISNLYRLLKDRSSCSWLDFLLRKNKNLHLAQVCIFTGRVAVSVAVKEGTVLIVCKIDSFAWAGFNQTWTFELKVFNANRALVQVFSSLCPCGKIDLFKQKQRCFILDCLSLVFTAGNPRSLILCFLLAWKR